MPDHNLLENPKAQRLGYRGDVYSSWKFSARVNFAPQLDAKCLQFFKIARGNAWRHVPNVGPNKCDARRIWRVAAIHPHRGALLFFSLIWSGLPAAFSLHSSCPCCGFAERRRWLPLMSLALSDYAKTFFWKKFLRNRPRGKCHCLAVVGGRDHCPRSLTTTEKRCGKATASR